MAGKFKAREMGGIEIEDKIKKSEIRKHKAFIPMKRGRVIALQLEDDSIMFLPTLMVRDMLNTVVEKYPEALRA